MNEPGRCPRRTAVLAFLLLALPLTYPDSYQDAQDLYTDAMMKLFDVEYFGGRIYEEVIGMLERAATLYGEAGEKGLTGLGASWREIGRCHEGLERYDEAEACYLKAHALFVETGNTAYRKDAALRLGDVAARLGDHEKAPARYDETVSLRSEEEKPTTLAPILEKIAASLAAMGKKEAAFERFTESVAINVEAGSPFGLTKSLIRRGLFLEDVGRPGNAREDFERALEISEEKNYRQQIVESLLGLSRCAVDLDADDEATAFRDRAVELQRILDEEEKTRALRKADDYTKNVVEFTSRNDPDRAINLGSIALIINERYQREKEMIVNLDQLGRIHYDLKLYGDAILYHERAAAVAEKIEEKPQAAKQHYSVGFLHEADRDYPAAVSSYRRAVTLYESAGLKSSAVHCLRTLGHLFIKMRRLEESVECGERALAYSRESGSKADTAASLLELGLSYEQLEEADTALGYFEEALKLYTELDDEISTARIYQRIGVMNNFKGRYETAAEFLEKSLGIFERAADSGGQVYSLHDLGNVYREWGRYDTALDVYQRPLALAEEIGLVEKILEIWNAVGQLYFHWGRYDLAEEYFQRTLEKSREIGNRMAVVYSHNNLALVYHRSSRLEEAEAHYRAALSFEDILSPVAFSTTTGNLGGIYLQRRDFDGAEAAFRESRDAARMQDYLPGVAAALNNLAEVFTLREEYGEAARLYTEALDLMTKMDRPAGKATTLQNLGHVSLLAGDWREAAERFEESITILEALRLTAVGDLRRDYFASVLSAYAGLIDAYLRSGLPAETFDAMESASAKYLAEQMGEKARTTIPAFAGIEDFRRTMEAGTALLAYSRLKRKGVGRESPAVFAAVAASGEFCGAREVDASDLVEYGSRSIGAKLDEVQRQLRGFSIKIGQTAETPEWGFEEIVGYYRHLLSRPFRDSAAEEEFRELSRRLYDLLIDPVVLEGKDSLVILPDSVLWLLPFESLIMPDGRYLVEEYQIHYLPSLSVSGIISGRGYGTRGGGLLALGGAVYDEVGYDSDMVASEQMLADLQKRARSALASGGDAGDIYHALDMAAWTNLPGTLTEVRSIEEIVGSSTVLTGREVTEGRLKALSQSGRLADFKVIHFATHGLAVPEMADLSAIVLSQLARTNDGEDGYLTAPEIAALDIRADFVNLSACETGLGKIYGGEGVVGLAQSFLVAGANSLSVSLWQVADESTMVFMVGLYGLIERKGLGRGEAIAVMKRRFLAGTDYRDPFYWAPFVYYGN